VDQSEEQILKDLIMLDERMTRALPYDRAAAADWLRQLLQGKYEDHRVLALVLMLWSALADQLIFVEDAIPHLDDPRPFVRLAVYQAIRRVVRVKKTENDFLVKHFVAVVMGLTRKEDTTSLAMEIEALAALIHLMPSNKESLVASYAKRRSPLLVRQLLQAVEGA
jgi:hypothetical protein